MRTTAAAIAILAAAADGAYAQEQPQTYSEPGIVEEVMVTARRREESAQSVPIAITTLSSEQIENLHVDNLENLQTVVPTLSVSSSSGRPNSPVYSLRGIRPTEALYGQDPTVAVYFADFVLSPAEGSNLGLYDLASVQVLKGPQGTLFGRNTTGGAILFTPRRPGADFGGEMKIGFGSYGRTEAQLGVDLPVSGNLTLRFAARTIDSDGYQRNLTSGALSGSKLGGGDTQAARLSAVWDITEDIENYTVLSWDDKETNGRATVLQAINPASTLRCYDGPANPNGACFPGENLPSIFDALARAQARDVNDVESDMRQYDEIAAWSAINTTTVQLGGDLTLKSIAGYRDVEAHSNYDIDSSSLVGVLTAGPQTNTLGHASYELQLLGTALDKRLDWVTGLYWYHENGYSYAPGDVLQGINPNNPFMQRGDVENDSYSVFAQGTFSLAPQWSLTAGARWTKDEKRMVIATGTPTACTLRDPASGAPLPMSRCSVSLSDSFSQPTGTLSVDYKPADDVLLYAASRLGYRSGGFNFRAVQPIEYPPFDPETVVDLELGSKSDWTWGEWRMRSNVALYQQWYDDIQRTVAVTNPVGVPGSAVQNAAKAKVFGIELEQTISPTQNLSLQLSYAFTDPKYEEWVEPATGADLSRTPFHFTPKHAGSALVSYSVPLGGDAGKLHFSANGAYRGDVWINNLQNILTIQATPLSVRPALMQEAYWLFDLSADWMSVMGSSFDISAYVKNLTDEEYAIGGVQLYTTFGLTTKAYAEPRTFGVGLRYNF